MIIDDVVGSGGVKCGRCKMSSKVKLKWKKSKVECVRGEAGKTVHFSAAAKRKDRETTQTMLSRRSNNDEMLYKFLL
jgi:hypothetical protein